MGKERVDDEPGTAHAKVRKRSKHDGDMQKDVEVNSEGRQMADLSVKNSIRL